MFLQTSIGLAIVFPLRTLLALIFNICKFTVVLSQFRHYLIDSFSTLSLKLFCFFFLRAARW